MPAMLLIDQIVLKRYTISEPLAEGGQYMAAKAIDGKSGQTVVVKQLSVPRRGSAYKQALGRLKRESAIRIGHPRVIDVSDSGNEDGKWFLIVPFVEGDDLQRHLLNRGGRLQADEATAIIGQIADGLRAMHAKGVIHRDLKPSNVIIHPGQGAHIIDLGICRVLHEQTITKGDGILGSLAWMPPEQIADATQVDQRGDLYALGAVFYLALTGRCPAEGDTLEALALHICQQMPPSPRQIEPSVPEHLETVCMRLLARDPAQRFQSVEDLQRELTGASVSGGRHCTACGTELSGTCKFCQRCGAVVTLPNGQMPRCLACGAVPGIASACPGCHRPFSSEDHELRFVTGSPTGLIFRIPEGIYIIGRDQLSSRDRHISSRQLSVACINGTVQVQHGGGVNMTFIDRQPAASPTPLSPNVEVRFAGNTAIYTRKGAIQP